MARRGLTDPYVEMLQAPDGETRLRHHEHPRYDPKLKGDADAQQGL